MKPLSAIACRTTLRRSRGAIRVVEGRRRGGDWIIPAIVAASAEREVGDVPAEEQPRGFADAVDRERSALTEPHVVQVQLEDLRLREPPLEHDRHEPFGHLPAQGFFLRQERVLHELLGQRAAAPRVLALVEDVAEDGAAIAMGSIPGCS